MAASDLSYYQPQTRAAIQRSKYLEDALAQMREQSGEIKGGWGEVAARLGATYLMERARKKANAELTDAMAGEAKAREGRITSWLPQAAPSPSAGPTPSAAPPSPVAAAMLQGGPPAASPAPRKTSLLDALMPGLIKRESGGRPGVTGPQTPYGRAQGMTQMLPATAKSMAEKIGIAWRPELMTGTSPEAAEYQQQLGRAYLQEGLDRYGGDPEKALKYYHGGPDERIWGPKTDAYAKGILGGLQMTGGPAPGPMQVQQQFPQQPGPQAPQQQGVMGLPPMPPPQPQPSPQAPPQAGAAPPGSPLPGGSGGWGPTPQEIALIRQLASDPRTQDQAQALSFELQKKYASAPKLESYNANGVPVLYNPYTAQPGAQGIPQQAMNQTVTGGQLNLPGDPNAAYSVDPYGKPTSVAQAPAGYQFAPGGMAPVRGGPQDPTSGGNLIEGEAKLRREYESGMQDYIAARNGYSKVVSAAQDGTGASDIALIFGFMKTLDPTSTVREGEFATAQNSGSVDQTLMNLYNKALAGERLQPSQRAQFAQTAANQFATYEANAKRLNERFSGLAQSYGFDPSRIIQQYDPIKPPQVSQAPGGGMQSDMPPGGRRAPDGKIYVPDPQRPGKWMRVD